MSLEWREPSSMVRFVGFGSATKSASSVFDEEFERDVVVAVAEERHARAGVAFALGARLLRQRGQQLERSAPRAHHHAGAAHLAVAVGVQRVHRVAFRLQAPT
ncbi:MAG: hypothetical protein ACLR3C_14400 [Eggerthella lenta]